MKKVNDKKPFTNVQLRNLSPEESKIIKDVMKITNESRASQALLKAAKQHPQMIIDRAKDNNRIRDLEQQNVYLKKLLEKHLSHENSGQDLKKEMKEMIIKMDKTIDVRQTRIG